MNHVNVPQAVRPYADQVVAVTDAVCLDHLDREYADLCQAVVGKLGRKRPSPLVRGDSRIWAAGVVHAVGQLNFLSDPSQTLHATTDQLSGWLGVKKTTMANKAKLIRDTLKLTPFDTEFMRRALVDASPLTWLLEVNGRPVDIRRAPVELQVHAFERGLIPYVPGTADDGQKDLDRLVAVITVDCDNLGEQVGAFYEVFAEVVPLPATATVVGTPIHIVGIDVADDGEALTALCRRGDVVQDLRLSEVVFPPDSAASWVHAAYRRSLGLVPYPAAVPDGWKPSWL